MLPRLHWRGGAYRDLVLFARDRDRRALHVPELDPPDPRPPAPPDGARATIRLRPLSATQFARAFAEGLRDEPTIGPDGRAWPAPPALPAAWFARAGAPAFAFRAFDRGSGAPVGLAWIGWHDAAAGIGFHSGVLLPPSAADRAAAVVAARDWAAFDVLGLRQIHAPLPADDRAGAEVLRGLGYRLAAHEPRRDPRGEGFAGRHVFVRALRD